MVFVTRAIIFTFHVGGREKKGSLPDTHRIHHRSQNAELLAVRKGEKFSLFTLGVSMSRRKSGKPLLLRRKIRPDVGFTRSSL